MAQTGYTPISIYYSATTTNVPTAGNLVAGELAINTADGKLFYKDSSGVVQTIASKTGIAAGSNTQVQYNSSGSLAGSANFIWDNANVKLGIGKTPSAGTPQRFQIKQPDAVYSGIAIEKSDDDSYLGIGYWSTSAAWTFQPTYQTTGSYLPIAFATNGSERMRIDTSGNVGIGASPSSEWASTSLLQVTSPSTYSTISLSTTRTVASGNRIGSIVFEMPNNTANYRTRAEIECDMIGSTANKFGGTVRINVAPDNVISNSMTNSATFNQYGIGLNTNAVSGTGIAFPATQNPSSDANTLDDYEEGTWTPIYSATGATFTYGGSEYNGSYTKIGNMVFVTAVFNVQSRSGGSGNLSIAGLPFAAKSGSSTYYGGSVSTMYGFSHSSSFCQFGVRIVSGTTTSQIFEFGTQGTSSTDNTVAVTQMPTGASYATYSWVYQSA
jgi:hypothetical protein